MTRALLIVDVQNDFTEGGALAVTGGAAVAAGIHSHLRRHGSDYALVLASRDWHEADSNNGGHFAPEPDYVDTWPVHCVGGTAGAEYHPELGHELVDVHVRKGQGRPDYSAFQGVADDGRSTAEVLAAAGITDLDVVGIATDHCVRASALDALAAGLRVRVLNDLVAGVGVDSSVAALDEVVAGGGEVIAAGSA